jgi:hypothetical protein
MVLSLGCAAASAQTTYKCMDERRQVTYSNIPCEKQGLKDGGPVADRTTSMPFTAPPKPAAGTLPTVKVPVPADDARIKPASPLIEKLVK